jgi:hypothetical protein
MTPFTKVTGKHLQFFQGVSRATAFRLLVLIRDSCGVEVLLIYHLAKYWGVPHDELISSLSSKKK